jgi:hypothetical protein
MENYFFPSGNLPRNLNMPLRIFSSEEEVYGLGELGKFEVAALGLGEEGKLLVAAFVVNTSAA